MKALPPTWQQVLLPARWVKGLVIVGTVLGAWLAVHLLDRALHPWQSVALVPPARAAAEQEQRAAQAGQPQFQAQVVVTDTAPLTTTAAITVVEPTAPPPPPPPPPATATPVTELRARNGVVILVPTATPPPLPTQRVVSSQIAALPQVRVLPAAGIKLPPTKTPLPPTPEPTVPPTPIPLPVNPGRLWATFIPKPAPENDHYWVERPFLPSAQTQTASPSYQFGSTAGNLYRPHHGADIANPFGTPVLAATSGTVVHAGLDDPDLLGPYGNFYGNTVVILLDRKLPVGDSQLDVFLLYGHLSQVNVTKGQHVEPTDVVGAVGMTGIAIGPHLHVEMRVGANTYRHSINPYLWVKPLEGSGTVAVRLLTADGRTLPGARLTLALFDGSRAVWARLIETYLDVENIGPDPAWGENGAMDNVPPGTLYLVGVVNGQQIRQEVTVRAGETSFVEIRTQQ